MEAANALLLGKVLFLCTKSLLKFASILMVHHAARALEM
jgi:hypothetical protein